MENSFRQYTVFSPRRCLATISPFTFSRRRTMTVFSLNPRCQTNRSRPREETYTCKKDGQQVPAGLAVTVGKKYKNLESKRKHQLRIHGKSSGYMKIENYEAMIERKFYRNFKPPKPHGRPKKVKHAGGRPPKSK